MQELLSVWLNIKELSKKQVIWYAFITWVFTLGQEIHQNPISYRKGHFTSIEWVISFYWLLGAINLKVITKNLAAVKVLIVQVV